MRARPVTLAAAALFAVGLAQSPVSAQLMAPSALSVRNSAPSAETLHARAAALFTVPARYGEAATLLVRAAGMRQPGDPQAAKDLYTASRLHAYAQNWRAARASSVRAAELSLESGDVVGAAHAYLDAALMALNERDVAGARALTLKAERLAASPYIGRVERNEILMRIHPARVQEPSPPARP